MKLLKGERCKDGWVVTLINTMIVPNRKAIEKVIKEFGYKIIQKENKLIKAEKR